MSHKAAMALLLLLASESMTNADVLARGRQLLAAGKTAAAAAMLLAKPCRPDARCKEQRYWTAEALWRCGQRSAALQRMAQVVAVGGSRFEAAATRLTQSGDLPLFGVLDTRHFLQLPLHRLSRSVRSKLLERVGHWALRQNQLATAERLLQSADSPRGEYLRAVIAVRRGSSDSAARLFKTSEKGARQEGNAELADLSALARGRLADSIVEAKQHYLRVRSNSPWFFRARQELAWHLLSDKSDKSGKRAAEALLQTLALSASSRRALYYRPDAEVVEAAAFLALGHPATARERARAGQTALTVVVENLTSFLRRRREVRLYYISAAESIARKNRELLPQIQKSLLADPSFRRAVLVLRQQQRERDLLFNGDPRLRHLLANELDQRLVRWQQRAGETVWRLLVALRDELRLLRLRCREVLFESSNKPKSVACQTRPRVSQSGVVRWPFIGEYWADELPHYQLSQPARLSQPCGRALF